MPIGDFVRQYNLQGDSRQLFELRTSIPIHIVHCITLTSTVQIRRREGVIDYFLGPIAMTWLLTFTDTRALGFLDSIGVGGTSVCPALLDQQLRKGI